MEIFFEWSDNLEIYVTKRLQHIMPNWELMWDKEQKKYIEEENSFSGEINTLIEMLKKTEVPDSYHDSEDILAEYYNESFRKYGKVANKVGNRWDVADYGSLLEQGAFKDIDQEFLIEAARGRIETAIKFGQNTFDEMEQGHAYILGDIIANILYHRENDK